MIKRIVTDVMEQVESLQNPHGSEQQVEENQNQNQQKVKVLKNTSYA